MKQSWAWGVAGVVVVAACSGVVGACSASPNVLTGGGGGDGGGGPAGAGGSGAAVATSSMGGMGGGAGGMGGTDFTVGVGPGGTGGGDGCDDETKGSIYILGQNKEFARFEPETQSLTVMGALQCPGQEFGTTFSMSVDRQGVAWVLFSGGQIYHVDTKTLVCTATPFVPCQSSFCQFGMGFVSDAPGATEETLYISGVYNPSPGLGLAKLDTKTLTLTPIADYDLLAGKGAELTGTGDARLFGYFQDTPVRLAEIDKSNAHIVSHDDLIEVPSGTSWAFAFWGGSFYIMSGTGIRKYEPMSQITTLINGNVGFNIVGAGVSTCAPVIEPE